MVITSRNRFSGDYEYKARHARVASLVFRGAFADDNSRVDQIIRVISSLDIGYSTDEEAIRKLTSGRNLTSLIGDIIVGRRMYDAVAEYLNFPWFIWHQRAIYDVQYMN